MKTVNFFTLGCKVNQYDTQSIRRTLLGRGFKEADNGKADIYIINTCTVTSRADRSSRYFINLAHRQNPKAKIIVTGCYAELDRDKIRKIPGVTEIVKLKERHKIPDLLNELTGQPTNQLTSQPVNELTNQPANGHTRAFLKIQDGCNNFCSYCKVPLVRGASESRPLSQVIREAENLVGAGFKEIVLCGICLGAYGRDLAGGLKLISVVEALEKIEGLARIRLSSIEPQDVSLTLIRKMADSKKLCRHLHIPLQSGDDETLKKMNRRYAAGAYLALIQKIKREIPGIAITTDCLVGFPAETEAGFRNTLNLIKEIMPLKVHIFPYSARAGTSAARNFKNVLKPEILKERLLQFQGIASSCALAYKKQFLGKSRQVLIEERAKENRFFWQGYTDNYLKVRIKSRQDLRNQLVWVKLKEIVKDCIIGDFC